MEVLNAQVDAHGPKNKGGRPRGAMTLASMASRKFTRGQRLFLKRAIAMLWRQCVGGQHD
jgi:hypothetical protein